MSGQRNVYIAALKGAHVNVTPNNAGMWLFSGEGQTAAKDQIPTRLGTDIIDLNQLITNNEVTLFGMGPRNMHRFSSARAISQLLPSTN